MMAVVMKTDKYFILAIVKRSDEKLKHKHDFLSSGQIVKRAL